MFTDRDQASVALIAASKNYPIQAMCRVLQVSASGFYAWNKRQPSARATENAALVSKIRQIHEASRGTYGAPRIQAELNACGFTINHKRVARLMRWCGLCGVSRRKGVVTTKRDDAASRATRVQSDADSCSKYLK